MSKGKKVTLAILLIVFGLFSLFGIAVLLAVLFGCKVVISDANTLDWTVVSAIATCVGVIVSVFIPITVVFLQAAITKNTERADALILELADFKAKYGDDIIEWAAWNRGETTRIIDGGAIGDLN